MRTLNITHLYKDLLNLYGDKGNVSVLKFRAEWRGIEVNIKEITENTPLNLENTDILILGGGSDREEEIVLQKLMERREELCNYAKSGGVILATCGGFAMLGNSYQIGKKTYEALGILDIETTLSEERLIENTIIDCKFDGLECSVIGFSNHATETDIKGETPLGNVVSGFGNSKNSESEGAQKDNVFATYLHGPVLPKNPVFADVILKRALVKKYGDASDFKDLADELEQQATKVMYDRLVK